MLTNSDESQETTFQHASEELEGDREIVLEAVKRSGCALRYASAELQGDSEIVLEAVKQNGMHFNMLQQSLKEIVILFLRQ